MAILSTDEILNLIENPLNTHISKYKKDNKTMSIYVKGGDVATELEKIRHYENKQQEQLRKDIAKSTKDKVADLLNPLHKIFNASGGSIQFDKISEQQSKQVKELIDELPEGISMGEWMETYVIEAMVADPNGIVLIETGNEDNNTDGKAYPTYKNIQSIHDYSMTWDSFDYLILLHKKVEINKREVQIYRVYDDEKDALFYVEQGNLKEYGNTTDEKEYDEEHIFNHNYGFVPAVVCGSIVDKETKGKLSFLHKIDESLKEFLRASSIFSIYKFLHLFPRFWHYAQKCSTCNGTGQVKNYGDDAEENPKKVCPTCKGKRLKVATDVSDAITLPIPENGQPVLGDKMAGFIDLPITAWNQMKEDLRDQHQEMEFSLWGSYLTERETSKERTATESFINVQPINEKLCTVSRWIETKESQIASFIAKIVTQNKDAQVIRKYGKRFTIESPDALWNKYLSAKEKQAPVSTLDYHYEQYLMSEYQNDFTMYETRKKMFSIEPFAHYTINEMVTEEQKQKKLSFSQWINSDINWNQTAEKLSADFEKFYNDNTITTNKEEV